MLVPTSDDVAASLGTSLRKWRRSLMLGSGTELWSRLWSAPVPQIDGVCLGRCCSHVPKEHVQNRLIGVVPVPQITDDIGEVTQRAPERMHTRVVEQIVDLAVPLILEKIVEIMQLVPLERIKDQIVDHIGGVPVPQIKDDVLQHVPERVQNLVGEQIVDVPCAPDSGRRFAARV